MMNAKNRASKAISAWENLEERVRELARSIFGVEAAGERVAGIDFDSVLRIKSDHHVFIEVTKRNDLAKVREDCSRLAAARNFCFSRSTYFSGFIVLDGSPTPAMESIGNEFNIVIESCYDFEKRFFDFPKYLVERKKQPFGSSIDPTTGAPDNHSYVEVSFKIKNKSSAPLKISDIERKLLGKQHVILTGEYGTGKSRCFKAIYESLSKSTFQNKVFPLAINLKDTWGLENSEEIIRRHFQKLGLAEQADSAIRAFYSGAFVILLDGFDEVGSQAWSDNVNKLREIKVNSLQGVRSIIQESSR
ncbi:MAG: hypothetical protein AAFY97_05790, partial [Pseudomonadota bacterium]